eukprot:1319126-Prymnesium_polylepis.1
MAAPRGAPHPTPRRAAPHIDACSRSQLSSKWSAIPPDTLICTPFRLFTFTRRRGRAAATAPCRVRASIGC